MIYRRLNLQEIFLLESRFAVTSTEATYKHIKDATNTLDVE